MGRPWQSQPGTYRTFRPCRILKLIDDIFQNLVEGMANMEITIGIGWPVVQDKFLPRVFRPKGLVNLLIRPKFLELGLALNRIGPHVKLRAREIDSLFIQSRFSHSLRGRKSLTSLILTEEPCCRLFFSGDRT